MGVRYYSTLICRDLYLINETFFLALLFELKLQSKSQKPNYSIMRISTLLLSHHFVPLLRKEMFYSFLLILKNWNGGVKLYQLEIGHISYQLDFGSYHGSLFVEGEN
jgi:hypothetical protein